MAGDRTVELETIRLEFDGRIARVVLNRPDRLNAVNRQMFADVRSACDQIEDDLDTRVVIVKGSGRAFCTGFDMATPTASDAAESRRPTYDRWHNFLRYNLSTWRRFRTLSKPTIAQTHGYCLAAGLMVAQNCDLVYTADDCEFGQPETRAQGTAPDFAMWPFTIGVRRTREMLFTGYTVDGRTAADWGMVNRALPADQLEAYVEWMAAKIASVPPELLHIYKNAMNRVEDAMGAGEMVEMGIDTQTIILAQGYADDFRALAAKEGIKAALADRDAAFESRLLPDGPPAQE